MFEYLNIKIWGVENYKNDMQKIYIKVKKM